MYNIKHCVVCGREIHIHKNRITGHPEPCEHIRKRGRHQTIKVRGIHGIKIITYKRKLL